MRLDKFLANLKYGTRKSIKSDIKLGFIKVDNMVIYKEDFMINPLNNLVYYKNNLVYYKEQVTLMINKPKGYLSANNDSKHLVITSLVKEPYNRFDLLIAGRLDLESHGLMILTTNGQFAHQITSPNSKISKTYEVILDKPFTNNKEILLNGIMIKDDWNNDYLAVANQVIVNNDLVTITISSGKFHQVRRMFKALGYNVIDLKRIKIGKLSLENLEPGKYRQVEMEDIL